MNQSVDNHAPAGRGTAWVIAQIPLLSLVVGLPPVQFLVRRRLDWPAPVMWAVEPLALVAMVASLIVFYRAHRVLGPGLVPEPRPPDGAILQTHDVYALVRHPVYFGLIMFVFSWALAWQSVPDLVLVAPVIAFFWFKSRYEERYLVARFAGYRGYRNTVPALVPRLRRPRT